MKKIIFIIVMALSFSSIYAKPVNETLAGKVAETFLGLRNDLLSGQSSLRLIYTGETANVKGDAVQSAEAPSYFVYSLGEQGFIIVSGDDATYPVLGFSTENNFDASINSKEIKYWLDMYKSQIDYVRENDIKPTYQIEKQWNYLLSGDDAVTINTAPTSVQPLVKTKWNQAPFYNEYCPYDESRQRRSVAGCVAIAMAQVMKYWSYPLKGTGSHSYSHYKFGSISSAFNDYDIPWNTFQNSVYSSNEDLAYTIFMIGVSVDMRYSVDASGAFVISATSPYTHCSEFALKNYWKYDPTIKGIEKDKVTDEVWENTLKTELIQGRPIIYTGFGEEGGHAWVCDGFREDNYYSMNWGWGGSYNGYYKLSALSPGTGGIGSGSGTFNAKQELLVGIQPLKANNSVITISGNLSFGEIPTNTPAETVLIINNLGSVPFEVSSIETSSKFSIIGEDNFTVPAGGSKTIKVQFNPSLATNYSAVLKVNSNANFGVSQITLSGKGITKPVSVEENEQNRVVYPNPATNNLNINLSSFDEDVKNISIVDISGKTVSSFANIGAAEIFSISLSEFTSGNYFLKVETESGRISTEKFAVSK